MTENATTIVLEIDLTESTERREWSYLELMQNHLATQGARKENNANQFSADDSLEEKRLANLAKSLERKYGTMLTMQKSGKRKRVRIDDFLDPGEGYDTQDSFIDDSEAVDVYVAPNVSTKHGGFYVYEGTVEGMEDHDAELEVPVGTKQTTNSVLPRPANKRAKSKELLERAVKCLSTPKPSPAMNRSKMAHLDSVFDAVLSNPPANSPKENGSVPSTSANVAARADTPNVKQPTSENTKSLPTQKTKKEEEPDVRSSSPPPLPPSLPVQVIAITEALIKEASSNNNGQRRGMSRPFEEALLKLVSALHTNKVKQSMRSALFAHLEGVLHLKRKTLMRRVKKLNEVNEEQKMHPLLDALGDAITRAMPPLLESYLRDKETHSERLKVWLSENAESNENAPLPSTIQDGSNGTTAAAATAPKRNPKPGPPKKLFRWNTECRHLFDSIITLRMGSYHRLNMKGPREEYVRSLFSSLMHLWPDGWITNAALWRAALPIFQRFTAPQSSPVQTSKHATSTTTTTVNTNGSMLSPPTSSIPSSISSMQVSAKPKSTFAPPRISTPNASTGQQASGRSSSMSSNPVPASSKWPNSTSDSTFHSPVSNHSQTFLSPPTVPHPNRSPILQTMASQVSNSGGSQINSATHIKSNVRAVTPPCTNTKVTPTTFARPRMSNESNKITAQLLGLDQSSPPISVPATSKATPTSSNQIRPTAPNPPQFRLPSISTITFGGQMKPTAAISGKVVQNLIQTGSSKMTTDPRVLIEDSISSGMKSSQPIAHNLEQVFPRKQLISNISFATNQINSLQQQSVSSTVGVRRTNDTPMMTAIPNVLLNRQPPPAHQQVDLSVQLARNTDLYATILQKSHSGNHTNAHGQIFNRNSSSTWRPP